MGRSDMKNEFNADTWTEQDSAEFMTPPKPPITAPCVPVAAPERDLTVRSALFFKLGAVAQAAEALHAANQLEMSQAAMNDRWRVLEDALNEWRAGE